MITSPSDRKIGLVCFKIKVITLLNDNAREPGQRKNQQVIIAFAIEKV